MNFNLTRIRRRGFFHSSAFNEVMDSVAWSLSELGHTANITENWIDSNDRNIIFGAELLAPNQPAMLPKSSIIYNLEQPAHPGLAKVRSMALTCGITVWDYSLRNIKDWQSIGVDAKHVPIGYTPNLTRIPKAANQDIDVLFLGWMTPRRTAILDELKASGLNVVSSDKCYGGGRDNLISRAKVCLNIHQDGMNLFEIVRVSYWLANGKAVLTEISEDDSDYPNYFVKICPYDSIVGNMADFINDRENWGFWGLKHFSKYSYTDYISKAFTESSPQDKVSARYVKGSPDIGHYMEWLKDHANGTILEIGVRDGGSTSAFLSGLQVHGGVLLSIDIEDCSSLFEGHPQWKFIRSDSKNPKLRVPEIDILFIDGDHTREGYRGDLERFFPLVKPGGMIISHDINPDLDKTLESCPGSDYPSIAVMDEYYKFCNLHNLRHEELPGRYGMGIMYKPKTEKIPEVEVPKFVAALNPETTLNPREDVLLKPPDKPDSDESWQASEALLADKSIDELDDDMDVSPDPTHSLFK